MTGYVEYVPFFGGCADGQMHLVHFSWENRYDLPASPPLKYEIFPEQPLPIAVEELKNEATHFTPEFYVRHEIVGRKGNRFWAYAIQGMDIEEIFPPQPPDQQTGV